MGYRRSRQRGQSLVEFAIIVPLMLTLLGATIDLARLYHTWVSLEASTRDAAEYAATNDTTLANASADARAVVCAQMAASSTCTDPSVTVLSFSSSTTAPGASPTHPIVTVTVSTTTTFRTLFPYPLLSSLVGTLGSTRSYSIVQGRTS